MKWPHGKYTGFSAILPPQQTPALPAEPSGPVDSECCSFHLTQHQVCYSHSLNWVHLQFKIRSHISLCFCVFICSSKYSYVDAQFHVRGNRVAEWFPHSNLLMMKRLHGFMSELLCLKVFSTEFLRQRRHMALSGQCIKWQSLTREKIIFYSHLNNWQIHSQWDDTLCRREALNNILIKHKTSSKHSPQYRKLLASNCKDLKWWVWYLHFRTRTCFSPSRYTMFDAGAQRYTHMRNTVSLMICGQVLKAESQRLGSSDWESRYQLKSTPTSESFYWIYFLKSTSWQ